MSELLFKVHFFQDLLFFPSGIHDEEIVISAKDYYFLNPLQLIAE